MSYLIILGLMIWAISAIIKSAKQKQIERNRQKQIARLNAEAKQRQLEMARVREEWKQRQAEAKAEVQRMVALEEAQMRMKIAEAEAWRKQETWNRKQEEINRKQEELNRKQAEINEKLMYTAQQAREDIENLKYKISEQQKYSEYLERERDACVEGSKEYFKWHNKLAVSDDKIYRMAKQMNKATFTAAQAERKISA